MGRPTKQPPSKKPADEQPPDDDSDLIDEDPDDSEEDPATAEPRAPQPPVREPRRGPLDEPVARPGVAPGALRFGGGLGGPAAAPGFPNALPPLRPVSPFGQPGQPRQDERHERREDGGYVQEAGPIEGEEQLPPGDEPRAREVLSELSDDLRVNVAVFQCGPGTQLIPRGEMEDVLLSYARRPTRYIPYGGKWHLEFYSAGTGHLLRNGRKTVVLPGDQLPLEADWRIDVALDEERRFRTMYEMFKNGMEPGYSGRMLPREMYGTERSRNEILEQRIADLQKQMYEDRLASQQREFDARLRQLEQGGAGGQNQVVQTISALGTFLGPMLQQKGGDSQLVEMVLRMNGPEMMVAQAQMYQGIVQSAISLGKAGGGGDGAGAIIGMLAPHFKGAAEKFVEGMNDRQKARDAFVMEMKRKEAERREGKPAQASAPQSQPTQPAAQPAQEGAQPGNGASKDRQLFGRMFSDVKQALVAVADPAVPQEKKPSPDDVGRKLALCMQTSIEMGLWRDELVHAMVKECVGDPATGQMSGDPEGFIAKIAVALNTPQEFATLVTVAFRKYAGMPPLKEQPNEPAAPSPAEDARPAAAAQPPQPPAPAPSPVVPPAVGEPASAPVAGVPAVVEDAAVPSPPAAVEPPSAKVEGEHPVDAHVSDAQGPDHVVEGAAEPPAGQGVEAGDAEGERGQPAQEDGVGLVEPPVPAPAVEKPPVP